MTNRVDDFNRANGTALATPSDGGSAWQAVLSSFITYDNAAQDTSGTGNAVAVLETSVADVDLQTVLHVIVNGATNTGLVARLQDSDNFIWAQVADTNNYKIFKRISGSNTAIADVYSTTPVAGDTLTLTANGSALAFKLNGTTVASATCTDFLSNTKHGIWSHSNVLASIDSFSATGISSDTTAPTLSSASVSSVGATTATGNITTDEGNGTLYSVVTTSATAPSAAQVQAGQDHTGTTAAWSGNQAVSSTGAKTFSITGLSNSTNYYAHFQHKDSSNNNSTLSTSAQFTTATPDTTNPTLTGSVTISAKTTTSYTASWPSGSDNVAVTGYEYRLNAGSWVDVGNVLTTNISARTPGATDTFEVRAYDASANKSTPALSVSVTLLIGTITIPAVKDWGTGNLKTSQTGVQVDIHTISTGALLVRKTGQTTHATTGVCVVQDAAIADATTYEVITRFSDGSKGMWDYTASLT